LKLGVSQPNGENEKYETVMRTAVPTLTGGKWQSYSYALERLVSCCLVRLHVTSGKAQVRLQFVLNPKIKLSLLRDPVPEFRKRRNTVVSELVGRDGTAAV
jgi:hypothetical protein